MTIRIRPGRSGATIALGISCDEEPVDLSHVDRPRLSGQPNEEVLGHDPLVPIDVRRFEEAMAWT